MADKNYLYDIYLIRGSGVPIVAGCTGSAYCRAHSHQHMLHAGFFSAILSFSKEAFQDTELELIKFDSVQLNVKINHEHDFFIVLVHPSAVRPGKIRKHLNIAEKILLEEFPDLLEESAVKSDRIEEYKNRLRHHKILPPEKKLKELKEMQLGWEEVISRLKLSKPSLGSP